MGVRFPQATAHSCFLLLLVSVIGFTACGDPNLVLVDKNVPPTPDAGPQPETGTPDPDGGDPSLSPWDWAESQDTIIAPWARQFDAAAVADAVIAATRITFPKAGHEEKLEYQRGDILWISSPDPALNVIRRIAAVSESGDNIVFTTSEAKADEVFFKVAIDATTETALTYTLEERFFDTRMCRISSNGPVRECSTFPELDADGRFLPEFGDPSVSAMVLRVRYRPLAEVALNEIGLKLNVDFFGSAQQKCACITQHYSLTSAQAILNHCDLGVPASAITTEVNNIKATCKGRVTDFVLEFDGTSQFNLNRFEFTTSGGHFAYDGSLPLAWSEALSVEIPYGWLTLDFAVKTTIAADVADNLGIELDHLPQGPGGQLDARFGVQWPSSPNQLVPRAYLVESEAVNLVYDPVVQGTGRGEVGLTADVIAGTRIWGIPGPSIIPIGTHIAASTRFELDPNDEGPDQYECEVTYKAGSRAHLDVSAGFPFTSPVASPADFQILDTCATGEEAQDWPEACVTMAFDPCEDP